MKIRSSLFTVFASIIMYACNQSIQKPLDINGKWIDVKKGNIFLQIDSTQKTISIDYSILGGKIFTSKYEINDSNEMIADILPKGARIEMGKDGLMKFYPLQKGHYKDIEAIYSVKFKRQ